MYIYTCIYNVYYYICVYSNRDSSIGFTICTLYLGFKYRIYNIYMYMYVCTCMCLYIHTSRGSSTGFIYTCTYIYVRTCTYNICVYSHTDRGSSTGFIIMYMYLQLYIWCVHSHWQGFKHKVYDVQCIHVYTCICTHVHSHWQGFKHNMYDACIMCIFPMTGVQAQDL